MGILSLWLPKELTPHEAKNLFMQQTQHIETSHR
jgi:hypothetical protein